jgi:hypothetical protein
VVTREPHRFDAGSFDGIGFSSDRLRQILVARYGWELELEAWHDAVAHAWEHRGDLDGMENRSGICIGLLRRRYDASDAPKGGSISIRWTTVVVLPAPPSSNA